MPTQSPRQIIYSWIVIAVIFFIIGRQTANKLSKIETTSKSTSTVTQSTQVQTLADTQKVSNLGQQTNYSEKFFSKKGILVHEIDYGKNLVRDSSASAQKESQTVYSSQAVSRVENTTKISFQPNFYLGINFDPVPLTKPTDFDFKQINLMGIYRVFGNVNLFAETNYQLSTRIGILIPIN